MPFKSVVDFAEFLWGDTISEAQIALLRVLYGLPLSSAERSLWRKYAETPIFARYKPQAYAEALCLLGRQSGKSSRIGVTVSLFEALCVEREIPAGSRLAILFFSPTLKQSTFDQVGEKLRSVPEFAELIEADADGEIRLRNQIDLVSYSANPRTARGRTAVLAVVDEAGFIRTDSSFEMNLPELLESVRPSLIVHRGKLLLLSSPSGKEGPLFETWEKRGENPDVLVWRAPSQAMNPAIDEKLLQRERKRGESYFRREYLAEFVEATNPFLPEAAIAASVQRGTPEFPPDSNDFQTFGAVDTADKRDSNALAIAAVRDFSGTRKVVVLKTKEWKPGPTGHNVLKILDEMGEIFRSYRVGRARGDQKNMSVCESTFARFGVRFERVITAGAGSESAYRAFLALLNDGKLVLPDDENLLSQLRRLEERTGDGNRFLVQGRRNSKDDVAVATVTAVALAAEHLNARAPVIESIFADSGGTGEPDDKFFVRRDRLASFARPRV